MKKLKPFFLGLVVACGLLVSTPALAQYGGDGYGQCAYGSACPPPVSEPVVDPPVDPEPGTDIPDEDEAPDKVVSDIDGDGNDEEAIDSDGDPSNGYEEYVDPDGSSDSLIELEDDDQTNFIIDSDNDGDPDVYWDPGNTYTAPIEVLTDRIGVGWFYVDNGGQTRVYYVERFTEEEEVPVPAPVAADTEKPSQRGITSEGFGGEIYESVGEFVVSLPKSVAYGFPYFLLSVIGLLVIRLVLQTKKELSRISVVLDKIKKERELVAEKQNFLMLSSHYMRTPMTVIKGNIELLQSLKTLNDQAVLSLQAIVNGLQGKVDKLLQNLEQDQGLATIQAPLRESVATRKILLSPQVLVPVVIIILVSVFAQFIFIDFRVTQPNAIDILAQTGIGILLVQILVSKVRKHKINKQNRQDQAEILEKQRELDRARAQLVNAAAIELGSDVQKLEQELQVQAAQGNDISRIRKGSDQLKNVINKFVFAAGLEAGKVTAQKEQFKGSEIVQNSLLASKPAADAKQVSLSIDGQESMLVQNKQLMSIVLSSLVENAVKYAEAGSEVKVSSVTNGEEFGFTVDNKGKEIEASKIDQLFKPFSRLESAETFDQEGLGFSLYLDRLIMMYLGGRIGIEPVAGHGTKASVSIPVLS